MRKDIFQKRDFIMHSGGRALYKIECDNLTDGDIETLAWIISEKAKGAGPNKEGSGILSVHGVPTGGERLANEIRRNYLDPRGSLKLIVDDVLTTGASMEAAKRAGLGDAGVVIFARGTCPNWVKPICNMSFFNTKDVFGS